ncbi:DUF2975 domain-containing protein [Tsuneonella sp. YG55]|uniref:DUF2975 domain-containing protein n=1 Tax=Tsuneonella litorea TaxID=2976475 RepID=A0A9X2W044_9SPHN|nr:DUF2975 domain-containing protein [Tsuneonella litorea]MCT2557576.1 DUF2975 domain-containing protein [Tsuneonella litorea]
MADTAHSGRGTDPLLLAGKVICVIAQIGLAVGAAALLAGIPVALLAGSPLATSLGLDDLPAGFPFWALAGVMAIGLAIVAMLFLFFRDLRRIIATVGEGDPFQPANATRLAQMGWLILGVQLVTLPAVWLGLQLVSYADEAENLHLSVDGGLDVDGILLVVVLFILARVFRHGAALRADLEGTV